MVIKLVA